MRNSILAFVTAAALAATSPLMAQQHQHPAANPQSHDMAAMMCGGGMPMMMHGMRMDSMKPGVDKRGMMDGMEMMRPPGPAIILQQKNKLELTAAQVTRLEELQKQAQAECMRHMQLAMTTHHAAIPLLDAAAPDFNAFTAKLKEASGHMVEAHVAMAKAGVASREILTAQQRQALKNTVGHMRK